MSDTSPGAGAEAARLVAAAQAWLRTSAPHLAPLDEDGATCSCPLCRGIARLRDGDPDVVARWVDGAVAAFEHVVTEAAAGMASATSGGARDGGTPDPGSSDSGTSDDVSGGADGTGAAEARHDGPPPRTVRRVTLDEPGTAAPARQHSAREE